MAFGTEGSQQRGLADDAVSTMLATNTSPGLDRFARTWQRVGGDWGHLNGSVVTAKAIAVAYYAASGLVLALKLAAIAQLTALAAAIVAALAAAVETLGASMAALAEFAEEVFDAFNEVVQATIDAISTYGPKLAELVGSLLKIGTMVLDARPIHNSDQGVDGPETGQQRQAREAAEEKRREDLAKDPAHGGNPTTKTEREADVALGCEANGSVPGPVTRATNPKADFTDGTGQDWDVKGFRSIPGKRGDYNDADAAAAISSELQNRENVALDIAT